MLRSDERLARSVAHGDDDAFALLYKRYEPTLFGYCRSITRNYDDACDALQNVSMKALVALRRSERTAPVRPWLFRIAHNESINVLRRRPAVDPLDASARNRADLAPSVDEQYATREKMDEIVRDLRELPTGQRAAIVLRELAELDYAEIAVALDINENNARQLVFAARTSLKDARSGRGLPCESVRDHITSTEGRRLRRRILRAHLQTCEPCREFARDRRRARPRRGGVLGLFSPAPLVAGLFDGASSVFGAAALKGATAIAVATAGLGAASVAPEVTRPPRAEAAAPEERPAKKIEEPAETPAEQATEQPVASTQPAQEGRQTLVVQAADPAPQAESGEDEGVQERGQTPELRADDDGSRPRRRRAPSNSPVDAQAAPAHAHDAPGDQGDTTAHPQSQGATTWQSEQRAESPPQPPRQERSPR